MSQYVLLESGKVIPIQTLRSLTPAELESLMERSKCDTFDEAIKKIYGDSKSPPDGWIKRRSKDDDGLQYENDDEEGLRIDEEDEDRHVLKDVDEYKDFDAYIGAEVLLPQNGDVMRAAKVIGRSVDDDGISIG